MTQRGIQDESKTSAEQAKSMNGNSASVPAGRGSDSTSPLPLPLEGRHAEETAGSAALKMGSTDSAGNARGPSCGLVSSLLPNSCRGSAEAFARCLHRRLTSLGNENGSPERTADAAKPCETSWLHPSSSNRHVITNNLTVNNQHPILQHQPRHSPESDLFYDIEVEEAEVDGPGSPPEEATAAELAHLLVNPEILKASHHDACHCSPSGTKLTSGITGIHQDAESCAFASPITGTPPDSDSSEMFFDPESSDADKSKAEVYFDPVSTSDSEATNLSNAPVPVRTKLALNGGRKRTDAERCEDTTSESSCSLRTNPASCENGCGQEGLVCSSEDSLNGRSSQETTSPSHESLWSTFDDSTVSLQDESPSRTIQDSVVPHICLPKSHSDSELPSNGIGTVVFNKLDRRDEEEEAEVDGREVDQVDFVNGISENVICDVMNGGLSATRDVGNGSDVAKDDSFNGAAEDSADTIEDKKACIELELNATSPKSTSQLKAEEVASDTDTDHSSYSSTVDIPDAFTLEYSNNATVAETTPRSELKLQIEKNTAFNDNDEKLCLLLKKLGGSCTAQEEDSSPEQETPSETVEEEEDRPQRVRRCSSLKTGKTPPGTPHRKKIVRFADKLGLDLADVRTFLDEIPKIPNSAYSDLIYDDIFRPQDSNADSVASVGDDWSDRYQNDGRRRSTPAIPRKIDRMLVPLFQQPGGMSNFLDIVRERRVCLENVVVQDPVTLAIQGMVRVINIDFHKSVHVRYTLNSWRNFSDLQAIYVPNSCDGFSDKFSFILYCHTLLVGQRLEFAVRFQCKGAQHWDNNAGANYCFQCLPASSSTGYVPITADECRRGNWSSMFY
ncbi:PREDICTED: glycogen-binding subunit 76A isoform X2 [Vollenhovia emeryi]|uniref:glycogen-binding subunit 76A isoform X2 n=1 Tax=Vollenhovia emeryi TaxID=411798 RepID=UPI0005F50787|nr:PREDICTED: glycogen-binding subunit 76A isoform X2 [Vollenhovia emeryi]